ncbi:MAG TPA: YdcF family protein [Thermoanaerobaculia bacterium]|nr:YdcF family protein [Thermoanaerobaculia bacterium]
MSSGKILTDPLLLALTLTLLFSAIALRRSGPDRRNRQALLAILGLTCSLWLFSTPIAAELLERAATVSTAGIDTEPDLIVVPGGGFAFPLEGIDDPLSYDSTRRVLTAAELWKRYPSARLVMSGRSGGVRAAEHRPDEMASQMARLAEGAGVPADRILLEITSTNTREHPAGLLRMPGIDRMTSIVVVTNGWHMRRALGEFHRHFREARGHAVPPPPAKRRRWSDFVPGASALQHASKMWSEWLGTVWYEILAISNR